jgi:hypothetical protein
MPHLRQTGCVCANRPLFLQTSLQKIWELYIVCLEGCLVYPNQMRRRLAQYLMDFFTGIGGAVPALVAQYRHWWRNTGTGGAVPALVAQTPPLVAQYWHWWRSTIPHLYGKNSQPEWTQV